MSATTRVVLCDDHPIVLAGLRNLIAAHENYEIVGTASNGIAALKLISETKPDIAIVDISMPELNGIALAKRLCERAPSVKLMVLTLHEDRAFLKQALDAGVRGYLLKRSAAESLIEAIRAVITGGLYVDPAIVDLVFTNSSARGRRSNDPLSMAELTHREADVLRLTALGHTTKETARRIAVGAKSVETYKARGMEKLGLRTRAELVRYAAAQGWLSEI